ncbi:hypothetical protein L210DRAFT_3414405, partial [Boletus edulis BED1]
TKQPIRLFYRPPLDCIQSLLSHLLLTPHISFVPRKIWTSAARVCRIYEDWMSGDQAWEIQEVLPQGATVLDVILSSDKMNISFMSGNRMAYPLLISLANITPDIRSKISLHTYLLLTLLPIPKFIHKTSRVRGLLHDRLIHRALNEVLEPLKTAAHIGIMMNDPIGNLQYCFTPLAGYIADTPEQALMACTNPKASPYMTATSKNFGDPLDTRISTPFLHPLCTGLHTVVAQEQCSPNDYVSFLKVAKKFFLNGVIEPCWVDWPLSCPSRFLHIEPLHHFHQFSWDHDVKWCVEVVTPVEIDFRFSLLQPAVGYCGFEDSISSLKQVTRRNHCSIQFLLAVHPLVEFRYRAQAPVFSDQLLSKLMEALELFHDNKDAVVQANGRKDSWEIPKLELLQSVVSNI